MAVIRFYKNLSLSKKIYFSTAIGFILGMFFGDKCGVLEPFNTLFIKLFQITILPYMVFSIIQSIGSMTTDNAKVIGKKGGLILIVLWVVSIIFAFCLQFSFPDIERSKFFQPQKEVEGFSNNLIDLFIPTNPFFSLANGLVPAIVIFCILIGMALIQEKTRRA